MLQLEKTMEMKDVNERARAREKKVIFLFLKYI